VSDRAERERAIQALFDRAIRLSESAPLSPDLALAVIHADLRRAADKTGAFPRHFVCDAGLGGLARWLRGAGYEACWNPALDDAGVIREARQRDATDSLMMERGVLRDRILPSVWIPSSLTCEEQLIVVLRELNLPLSESRCMKCGGELRRVEKHSVADRIPPRTARWIEEYFVCGQCGQLFWRGTHWQKITARLQSLSELRLSWAESSQL
jgi:hypothetical protein